MSEHLDMQKDREQRSTLCSYDMLTGEIEELACFPHVAEAPNWSQDGAYLYINAGGRLIRYTIADGGTQTLDTGAADSCNNDHVLAPDGSGIAFSSGEENGPMSAIYVLHFASGAVRRVVQQDWSFLHGWSPDMQMLAYCAARGGEPPKLDVYCMPAEGGEERRLTSAEGLNDGPEFSPDGRHIWFCSTRSGRMQIWRMLPDGAMQEQMTFDTRMNAWFPHVSPDGRTVVYIAYHEEDLRPDEHLPDKNVEIRCIAYDGGEERTLCRLFGGQGSMNVNSWSPDSRRFAFVRYGS